MKRALKQQLRKRMKVSLRPFLSVIIILLIKVQAFSQPVNIIFSPSTPSVTVNQNFNVDVKADFTAAGTLNVIEAYVNFNILDLQVVSTSVPASTVALLPSESVPVTVNAAQGRVDHGRFTSAASGHPNNDFVLFTITFKALRVPPGGTTPITFNTANPRKTIAVEGVTTVLNLTPGGTVTIQNCTPPTATIAGSNAASTCNGQPTTLRLSAATGTGPYTLVVDGNTYANVSVGSSFGTPQAFPTYKAWASTNPGVARQNDGGAIEVGNKFRTTQAGFIKGLRFYCGTGSYTLGTYKGKLWNFTTGALLGTVTYSGVTTGNWIEATFGTPISIAANTTYMVTVYNSLGNYVATDNYFGSAVTNGPLSILANSTSTNGMYFFGSEQSGPTTNFNGWSSFMSTNYWTDVIFTQNTNSFNLTSITDATGCTNAGALQTLNVTSIDCGLLPVTLLNLSASPLGRKITLRWSTSTEINNRGFDVERSLDGAVWTKIGFVAGAGNSTMTTNYTYADDNLDARKYYYRLNQTDIDGRSKYSVIVSAVIGSKGEYSLGQNYPNPFRNETTIQYTIARSEQVNISLFDMSGRTIKVLVSASKEAGTHAVSFHTGTLTKGIYYYRIQAGDFTDVKKMTIQ